MAASASYPVGGTVPTLVLSAPANPRAELRGWFTATVATGGSAVSFGGPNVTVGGPYSVPAGGTLTGFLFAGDSVYAMSGGGTVTVNVLQTGR